MESQSKSQGLSVTSVAKAFVEFYVTRLRRNYPGYFAEFYPYIIAATIAAFLDFYSTWDFMINSGVDDEFHPVIRFVSMIAGPIAGPLIGKVCQLLALAFLTIAFRPAARIIFIPITVIYLYGAWYNTWGIHIYTPLFLRLFAS